MFATLLRMEFSFMQVTVFSLVLLVFELPFSIFPDFAKCCGLCSYAVGHCGLQDKVVCTDLGCVAYHFKLLFELLVDHPWLQGYARLLKIRLLPGNTLLRFQSILLPTVLFFPPPDSFSHRRIDDGRFLRTRRRVHGRAQEKMVGDSSLLIGNQGYSHKHQAITGQGGVVFI